MVLEKMANQEILARRSHPDKEKYPHQFIFILELRGYICYVPFVENDDEIFLKTIIPSRKLNKEFKGWIVKKNNFIYDDEEQKLLDEIEKGEWTDEPMS